MSTRSRSKSKEKEKPPSSIPKPPRSTRSKSKENVKESSKIKSSKKSSVSKKEKTEEKTKKTKTKSDDKHSNKENRHAEKKAKVEVVEPVQEYEDDFEDYSDDFESDDDEKPTETENHTESNESNTKDEMRSEPAAERNSPDFTDGKGDVNMASSSSVDTVPIVKDTVPDTTVPETAEYTVEDTPLLRRLASRQGGRPNEQNTTTVEKKRETTNMRVSSADRNITFSTAVSSNLESVSESEKRFRKLRELITLESVNYSILDQPAVKDYDFYMELFGVSGKTQAYSQTGDDNVGEETQTENKDTDTKWTQLPAVNDVSCGSESSVVQNVNIEEEDLKIFRENHLQNDRLKMFLHVAGQVIIDLIQSEHVSSSLLHVKNKSQFSFSAGYHAISLQPTANKSRVTCITRSAHDARHVLISSFILESPAEDLISRTLLAEFFLDNSQPPKRLFLCEGEVLSAIYAPDDSCIFAGLKDGSVVVFDLLEAEYNFTESLPWLDSSEDLPLRIPCFDTSYLSATVSASTKLAPIVQIRVCSKRDDSQLQIAALSENGSLYVYSVNRDDSKLPGLRPGTNLSLAVTAIIHPDPAVLHSSSQPTALIANCMATKPETQQFFVGTDAGFLCSLSRTKSSSFVGPRLYKGKLQVFGEVTCVQLSVFDENILLAGLSSGCLSIFRTEQSSPTVVLTPPNSSRKCVTSLQWSPSVPCIFYSLHGGTRLLVWDLSLGKAPLAVTDLTTQMTSAVVTTECWLESSQESTVGGRGIGYMALGLQDGSVEIHVLEPLKPRTDEPLATVIRKIERAS